MKPTNEPVPPDPLGEFFGPPAGPPKDDPTREPRDDATFLASFGEAAEILAASLEKASRCGCKRCLLKLPAMKVNLFVTKETLAAAFTGNTAKLDALVEYVEQLKKPA